MPKTPKEMEKEILADGWFFYAQKGSHKHYKHPLKKGKITIPFHNRALTKNMEKLIRNQAMGK